MDTDIFTPEGGFSSTREGLPGQKKKVVNPVIKISLGGFLISANSTGVDFLELLSDELKVPAINYLVKYHPAILDPQCSQDIVYRIHDTKYFFSAVAFKEAGYIGLYGYRQVHVNKTEHLPA